MAALAATGALIVGGSAVAMVGSGNADPLDLPGVPVVGTTYVVPDGSGGLTHFTRGDGTTVPAEISDAFDPPAPLGGNEAALRLMTPTGGDKSAIRTTDDAGTSLEQWMLTAEYSAYQNAAEQKIQFPSMQLTIDYDPDSAAGFSTLFYEPANNPGVPTSAGEWHRYQAGAGNWCSTRAIPGVITDEQRSCSLGGAKPLAEYIAVHPRTVVQALVINQGSGNPGLDAGVDLVRTPSTTYDFELTEPAVLPDPDPTCTEPTEPSHEPSEEPSQEPSHPDEGQGGHDDGGEWGGQDGGHEQPSDGGHEEPDNSGHEEPDNGGHEEPDNGGHEEPDPQPEPDPCK